MIPNNPLNHSSLTQMQTISLEKGKFLQIEPGSMHACKNITMNTVLNGSVWNAVKMYFLAGESLFVNIYEAQSDNAWIALEEGYRGQVTSYVLAPSQKLILQKGAYVASDLNVEINTRYAGLTSWIKGMSFWNIIVSSKDQSPARVFFDTKHGIIKAIKVTPEDGDILIDNDHLIGYTSSLKMTSEKLGNIKTTLFSGEGFVNKISGEGTAFVGTAVSKLEKSNYLEKMTTKLIEDAVDMITDGRVPNGGLVGLAFAVVVLTSRAAEAYHGRPFF